MEHDAVVPLNSAAAIATVQRLLASSNIGIHQSNDSTSEPLDAYLHQDPSLRTTCATQVLHQVTKGVMAMHAAGIIHGDLRCGNIFVVPGDRVLLGGLDHCFDYNAVRFRMLSDKPASELGVSVSRSTRWLAPECVAGGVPTPASDVYAFGLTIYEAMTGEAPYANVEDAKLIEMKTAQAAAATSFSVSSNVSIGLARGDQLDREVWSLIQDMTQSNPMMRPSMQIVSMGMRGLQAKMSVVSKQPPVQPTPVPSAAVRHDPPIVQQAVSYSAYHTQPTPVHFVNVDPPTLRSTALPGLSVAAPYVAQPSNNYYDGGQAKVYPGGYQPSAPPTAPHPPTAASSSCCTKRRAGSLLVAIGVIVGIIVGTTTQRSSSGGSFDYSPTPTPSPTPYTSVETIAQGFATASVSSIAVTSDGTILVSDQTRIYKFREGGTVTPYIGRSYSGYIEACGVSAVFDGISSLTVDSNDIVYIADLNNRRIRSFTLGQQCVSTVAGDGTQGTFDWYATSSSFVTPNGLAVDKNNDVYITDLFANNIRKLLPSSTWVTTAVAYIQSPGAIAVASTGEIYFAQYNAIMAQPDPRYTPTVLAGESSTAGYQDGYGRTARFNRVGGIALSTTGDALFVVDSDNHCIRKVVIATQEVSTIAGICGALGSVDGSGSSAQFYLPVAVVVSQSNKLYVAEVSGFSGRVRKITLA